MRRGAGPGVAAAVSAALFAVRYGVLGFLVVFWSGLVWALAFERTRSLWPGVLAHAADNLEASLGTLLLLRG